MTDEASVDGDLDTLQALEAFLQEFDGVLIVIHDRSFADKVADHLFVFEGGRVVKDSDGTLIETDNEGIPGNSPMINAGGICGDRKTAYREDRNGQRTTIRRAKKDMDNLEKSIEKLKKNTAL